MKPINLNDCVGVDHGLHQIDLTDITRGRIAVEMRPVAIYHKANGSLNNEPSFCLVLSSVPEGTIAYGQISLAMLNKALNSIGYQVESTKPEKVTT